MTIKRALTLPGIADDAGDKLKEAREMIIQAKKYINNGGFEQGCLEMVKQLDENLLSKQDQLRLEKLQSLPQNRIEVTHEFDIKTKEGTER